MHCIRKRKHWGATACKSHKFNSGSPAQSTSSTLIYRNPPFDLRDSKVMFSRTLTEVDSWVDPAPLKSRKIQEISSNPLSSLIGNLGRPCPVQPMGWTPRLPTCRVASPNRYPQYLPVSPTIPPHCPPVGPLPEAPNLKLPRQRWQGFKKKQVGQRRPVGIAKLQHPGCCICTYIYMGF